MPPQLDRIVAPNMALTKALQLLALGVTELREEETMRRRRTIRTANQA